MIIGGGVSVRVEYFVLAMTPMTRSHGPVSPLTDTDWVSGSLPGQ
jgi:hypothetical protein